MASMVNQRKDYEPMAKQLTARQHEIMADILKLNDVAGCKQDPERDGYFYVYSYIEHKYIDFVYMIERMQSEITHVLGHEISRDDIELCPEGSYVGRCGAYIRWRIRFNP